MEGAGPLAPPPEAEYESLLKYYLDRRKETCWAPMEFAISQTDPSGPMPVPFPTEGMLPPPGMAYFVLAAEGAGIWSAIFAKSINDYGGHLWAEAYFANGDKKAAAHNGDGFSESDLGSIGPKIVRQAYLFPEELVVQALEKVEAFANSGTYNIWCHNCGDAVEVATKSLGIELPSFRSISGTTAPEFAYRYLLSSPYSFRESWLIDSWNNIKSPNSEPRQPVIKVWITDDLDGPSLFYHSPNQQISPSIFNANHEPFPSVLNQFQYGGIALNKRADLKISSSEITGAVFDSLSGQFILVGRKKIALPEMRIDDLAVAIKSIYGLGGSNPAYPAVSIDPSVEDTMTVTYFGQTYGTEFGLRLFQADHTLKRLVLGTLDSRTPGYLPLFKRFEKKQYIPKLRSNWRTWIIPEKITLMESGSKDSIILKQIKMKCLAETTGDPGSIFLKEFADHFTNWYDAFAVEYPIFQEMKRLAQITGTVKWLQENHIPVDLSYFNSYACIPYNTPLAIPSLTKDFAWVSAGQIYYGQLSGGISLKTELSRIPDESANDQKNEALFSRPDECSMCWDLPGDEIAEVCAVLKTRKAGNFHLDFVDLFYPSIEGLSLSVNRFYDSFNDIDNGMGYGWTFTPAGLEFSTQFTWVSEVEREAPSWVLLRTCKGQKLFFLRKFFSQGVLGFVSEKGNSLLLYYPDKHWQLQFNQEYISFNSAGKISQYADIKGNRISYLYKNNLLQSIQNSSNSAIELFYTSNRLTSIKGPDGKIIYYSYTEDEELEYAGPLNEQMRFEYDENHRLSGVFDTGDFFIFEGAYDDFNRITYEKWGPIESINEYDLKEQCIKKNLRVDIDMIQTMGQN